LSEEIESASLRASELELCPALKNPAVAHCWEAQELVYRLSMEKKKGRVIALLNASEAYCRAMPPLVGYENICDFIACVGYGLLTRVFLGEMATRLLYAAQVALSTIGPREKTLRREEGAEKQKQVPNSTTLRAGFRLR
jgi:hypothetical protein